MSKGKKKLVPKLRFPGFEGEWIELRMNEVFNEINDKVGKRKIPTYSITAGKGFVSQKEKFGKDISGDQNEKYVVIDNGQFSYNKGNSKTYNYGCIYLNDTGVQIAVPNVFISFELINNSENAQFYAKYFEAHYLDRELRRIISSSARMDGLLNVSKKNFFKLPISTSSDFREQRKIAKFLTSIDQWIENLEGQREKLEEYKKGMMQKIFSQEIRFKDDNGNDFPEWNEKKLGEIATFSKGKGISKSDIKKNGENSCIHYGELFTKYREKILTIVSKTDVSLSESKLSQTNDILMPTSDVTPNGLATASALNEKNVVLGGDILVIRSKKLNNLFFSYYISANKAKVLRLVNGVTVYHLYGSDMSTMKIEVPSLSEQSKIAEFLSSIDGLIETKNKQIKKAKKWKKGLLQQMFV